MAKKPRNYAAEYNRRTSRGLAKGLTRSQARGHARAGERTRPSAPAANPQGPEEAGLKMMKRGSSLKVAARANRISQERLRRYLRENTQASRIGRRCRAIG